MDFAFATCERKRALGFLKKLYPSYTVEDEGNTKEVLDFVEKDIIRIADPEFHGGQAIRGKKWNDEEGQKAMEALRKFDKEL